MLPVLYAVWPVDVSIPSTIEYEILYEVFNVDYGLQQMDTKVREIFTPSSSNSDIVIHTKENGELTRYDVVLKKYVPLVGVKVRFQNGTFVIDAYTDNEGKYNILGKTVMGTKSGLTIWWESDKWYITDADSNQRSQAIPKGWYNIMAHEGELTSIVHECMFFWFNGNHSLTKKIKNTNPGGTPDRMKIEVRDKPKNYTTKAPGTFEYGPSYSKIIIRTNQQYFTTLRYFQTVFHELGHASMYRDRGQNAYAQRTDKTIRESWGEFTGWYLQDEYYKSIGYLPTFGTRSVPSGTRMPQGYCYHCDAGIPHTPHKMAWVESVSGLSRQQLFFPDKDILSRAYSPLFIDLMDDFNQREYLWMTGREYFNEVPSDRIAYVPAHLIEYVAFKSYDRTTFQKYAKELIPSYFSYADFNAFWELYPKNWKK